MQFRYSSISVCGDVSIPVLILLTREVTACDFQKRLKLEKFRKFPETMSRVLAFGLVRPNLILMYLAISIALTSVYSQAQDPDPQCTYNRRGLPACNFNSHNCYSESPGFPSAWVLQKDERNGPVEPFKKGYVYLDSAKSNGNPRKLLGKISSGKKAICINFNYATNGSSTVPITILIQEGAVYKPAHQVLANTRGKWKSSSFSCCLPQQKDTRFAIEATSTADGIPAIDEVDVRSSNMPCGNGKLVCYPSLPGQTPLDPATGPRCSSNQVEPAVPSCEFNADDKKILEDCGWEVSSAWEVRQKIDGSGRYDVISSTSQDDATLLSEIGDDVVSFCLEIQFTVPDIREDLRNVLSVFIVTENSTEWGESYNYLGKDKTVWKRNNFERLLPEAFSQFKVFQGPLGKTGNTKIIFKVFPPANPTDKPVWVNFRFFPDEYYIVRKDGHKFNDDVFKDTGMMDDDKDDDNA
ncbi:hypothetical protein ElyMa_002972300 [Elysia marginata]|uniref:MAM domain-containing protein n=1 Tax=Elysia marginata TaxID=1093978 RepID=A0AAV4I8H4_9GAST|nr:hypothetical protein ElyMa_002972300 [Elysia marginata]